MGGAWLVGEEGVIAEAPHDAALRVLDLDLGQGSQEAATGVLEVLGVAEWKSVQHGAVLRLRDGRGVLRTLRGRGHPIHSCPLRRDTPSTPGARLPARAYNGTAPRRTMRTITRSVCLKHPERPRGSSIYIREQTGSNIPTATIVQDHRDGLLIQANPRPFINPPVMDERYPVEDVKLAHRVHGLRPLGKLHSLGHYVIERVQLIRR